MQLKMGPREPMSNFLGPWWWHHHGIGMRLRETDLIAGKIVIAGSAAEVIIARGSSDSYSVDWKVIHYEPIQEQASGRVWMNRWQLSVAFGLEDWVDEFSEWLIDRYGGTVACRGTFLRYEKYLNIPCPGTGYDGDPNVSIMLDEEIKEAVRQELWARFNIVAKNP